MTVQTSAELTIATPPVAVGGLVFAGMDLSEWVLILTALYTTILIIKNGPGAVLTVYRGVTKLWQKVQRLKRS